MKKKSAQKEKKAEPKQKIEHTKKGRNYMLNLAKLSIPIWPKIYAQFWSESELFPRKYCDFVDFSYAPFWCFWCAQFGEIEHTIFPEIVCSILDFGLFTRSKMAAFWEANWAQKWPNKFDRPARLTRNPTGCPPKKVPFWYPKSKTKKMKWKIITFLLRKS